MVRELGKRYYCVVDIELTEEKEIIQFSAQKLDYNFKVLDSIDLYIKPKNEVTAFVTELTGITNELLENKPSFNEVFEQAYDFIKDGVLVCHGLQSDYIVLKKNFHDVGIKYHSKSSLDTVELARLFMPTQKSYRLSDLADSLALYSGEGYHNAQVDVEVTARLLEAIAKRIATLDEKNFAHITKLLEKIDYSIYAFATYYRELYEVATYPEEYSLNYDGANFRRVVWKKGQKAKTNSIYFSSVVEEEYVKLLKVKNYEILKKRSSYVPLNIFSLFPKKEDLNLDRLLVKLYVWIFETQTGDFDELNLLYLEKLYLDNIEGQLNISTKDYFYDKKKKAALKSENIVTSYQNIEYILDNSDFDKHILVFENKKILARELDSKTTKDFFYKAVVVELNVAISQNLNNKKLKTIRSNFESLVKFLHEMYVTESLFLYKDSLDFILQDVEEIRDDIRRAGIYLPVSYKFIKKLYKVLTIKKNSYKFDILEQENTLVLTVVDDRRVKDIINVIHSRKHMYLKFNEKLIYTYSNDDFEMLNSKAPGSILYIFESSKYKDLYFSKREKKSYVKYINFSIRDSFSDLYSDIMRNTKVGYRCYATRDILEYRGYLKNIFDSIIILKDVEY